jgi:hypothetical protein
VSSPISVMCISNTDTVVFLIQVKGHISDMVLRLEDEDERIQNLVKLFFHELSNKGEFVWLSSEELISMR